MRYFGRKKRIMRLITPAKDRILVQRVVRIIERGDSIGSGGLAMGSIGIWELAIIVFIVVVLFLLLLLAIRLFRR
jgi:hypothetical protein